MPEMPTSPDELAAELSIAAASAPVSNKTLQRIASYLWERYRLLPKLEPDDLNDPTGGGA